MSILNKIEYGDFQTPQNLANECCKLLLNSSKEYKTIIEPTCGQGNFLYSALKTFSSYEKAYGLEINANYFQETEEKLQKACFKVDLFNSNFFDFDWHQLINNSLSPILIIGNPPWVTNSVIGLKGGNNMPNKKNFHNIKGIEAITGKSNFDISEWIILNLLQLLNGKQATLAMLCKTSVARKILKYIWQNKFQLQSSQIYKINTLKHFNVSVDACLFVCNLSPKAFSQECQIHKDLSSQNVSETLGLSDNQLISNISIFQQYAFLQGKQGSSFKWRSGIKHDCAPIMELYKDKDKYINGLNKVIDIEEDFIYPLLKSSDVANFKESRKHLLITQKYIGEDTSKIKYIAPKTWKYLQEYKNFFDKRKSSIYQNKPPFSIFGVGEYSFSPWKIAISGLYKKLSFRLIDKLQVCDDTVYFLPCKTKEEAEIIYQCLNSEIAYEFYNSLIFWDSKRPITAEILNQLNLEELMNFLGLKPNLLSKQLFIL